jgi:hypothetical protein
MEPPGGCVTPPPSFREYVNLGRRRDRNTPTRLADLVYDDDHLELALPLASAAVTYRAPLRDHAVAAQQLDEQVHRLAHRPPTGSVSRLTTVETGHCSLERALQGMLVS